jgi:hypothetical protein
MAVKQGYAALFCAGTRAPRHAARAHRDLPWTGRRGSLPPTGPCVVGSPASNRHPDPLPVRHVLTPAAPATQRRRRRTRAAPPLVGNWPSRLAAHPRPYHDPSTTTCLGVQGSTQPPRAGYKAGWSSLPRATGQSHRAPPLKVHGELPALATCTTHTCCSSVP